MKNSQSINRRTMLKGLGAVTIGLPMLEEMLLSTASAEPLPEVPVRAFNVFFGLGIPAPLQQEGFDGVLEPLKPLSDKLLIMRGVDQVRCDESGINAHYRWSDWGLHRRAARRRSESWRPIDRSSDSQRTLSRWVCREAWSQHLIGGTFFRRSRVGRYVHSYNYDGTVAATMQEKPRDLFERVFGSLALPMNRGKGIAAKSG